MGDCSSGGLPKSAFSCMKLSWFRMNRLSFPLIRVAISYQIMLRLRTRSRNRLVLGECSECRALVQISAVVLSRNSRLTMVTKSPSAAVMSGLPFMSLCKSMGLSRWTVCYGKLAKCMPLKESLMDFKLEKETEFISDIDSIIQGSTNRRALGLVNFVPALAYHFCLNWFAVPLFLS